MKGGKNEWKDERMSKRIRDFEKGNTGRENIWAWEKSEDNVKKYIKTINILCLSIDAKYNKEIYRYLDGRVPTTKNNVIIIHYHKKANAQTVFNCR